MPVPCKGSIVVQPQRGTAISALPSRAQPTVVVNSHIADVRCASTMCDVCIDVFIYHSGISDQTEPGYQMLTKALFPLALEVLKRLHTEKYQLKSISNVKPKCHNLVIADITFYHGKPSPTPLQTLPALPYPTLCYPTPPFPTLPHPRPKPASTLHHAT